MSNKDLPSESDCSDDEDYVPEGANGNVSEEEDSGDAESDVDESACSPAKKRRRKPEVLKEIEKPTETSKIDVDAIWADFKKDVEPKKVGLKMEAVKPTEEVPKLEPAVGTKIPQKPRIFSPVANTSKGGVSISSILAKIGKKDELSVFKKSALDWNAFKTSEGIAEDLKTHNKGKDGFLEKRDFLERTDMRQFEIEKQLRAAKRSTT